MFNLEQMLTRIETVTTRQPTQSQDEPPQFQSEVQRENEVEEKPKIPGNGVDAPIEISDDEMEA